jgi:hypothetical protein
VSATLAIDALAAAYRARLSVALDRDDLALEAAAEPSPALIDALARHKPEIVALLRLSPPLPPQLPGLSDEAWTVIRGNILRFVADGLADEAAGLGWSDLDLYAVHPVVGAARVDCCGALILARTRVIRVWPEHMLFASRLIFHRRPFADRQIRREPVVLAWAIGRV